MRERESIKAKQRRFSLDISESNLRKKKKKKASRSMLDAWSRINVGSQFLHAARIDSPLPLPRSPLLRQTNGGQLLRGRRRLRWFPPPKFHGSPRRGWMLRLWEALHQEVLSLQIRSILVFITRPPPPPSPLLIRVLMDFDVDSFVITEQSCFCLKVLIF